MSVSGMCGMEKKRHRVTNTVAQMNPGISKSDTSKRRSQTIHQDVRFLFGSKKKPPTASGAWPHDPLGSWQPGVDILRRFAKPTSRKCQT